MESSASELDKLLAVQRTELFAVNTADREEQKLSAAEWDKVMSVRHGTAWPHGVPDESQVFPPEFLFRFGGKAVSVDWFKKVNLVLMCLAHQPNSILELGAGFGQVARLAAMIKPGLRYTIIDLPESLYFAEIFLLKSGIHVERFADEKSLGTPYQVMLVPSTRAEDWARMAPPVDVFLNTSSLGEMDDSVSRFYLGLVQDKVGPKWAILLNRLLNTYSPIKDGFREHEAGWYWFLDNRWDVCEWDIEPDFTRIPYSEQFHNRELLWIAKRTSQPQWAGIESHEREYWLKHFSTRASDRAANQIWANKDLLRSLFESCRMGASEKSLDELIKYLHCIRKRHPFENVSFLFERYREVAGKPHELAAKTLEQLALRAAAAVVRRLQTIRMEIQLATSSRTSRPQ